jgi:hypothetical protein
MYRFSRERHSYVEHSVRTGPAVIGAALRFPAGRRNIQLQFGNKIVEVQETIKWVDADVLCRDDGLKLICLGHVDPLASNAVPTFRYMKDSISFDFAIGRALWCGVTTGACSSYLPLDIRVFGGVVPERAQLMALTADIDAALRAWPVPMATDDLPLGVSYFFVTIDDRSDGKFSRVFTGEFAHGQPLRRARQISARWRPERVAHPDQTSIRRLWQTPDRMSLVREDGVRLIRIPTERGPGNDGPDGFRYVDRDVAFDFDADYRFTLAHATDTWGVVLDPPGLQGLSMALRAQLGPERCAEIAGHIEEAFYAWPIEKGHVVDMPINRVVFASAAD